MRKIKRAGAIILTVLIAVVAVAVVLMLNRKNVSRLESPELVSAELTEYNEVDLQWKSSEGADGYSILRKMDGEEWQTISTIEDPDVNSFIDRDVASGTEYFYSVNAFIKNNEKYKYSKHDQDGIAVVTGVEEPMLFSAELLEDKQIKITWRTVENASGYGIYRIAEDGSKEELDIIADGQSNAYVDKTEKGNTIYTYTVRAFVEQPEADKVWSEYATPGVTILAGLDVPKVLGAKRLGEKWVRLQWEGVEDADGYCVYKKNQDEWMQIAEVKDCEWMDKTAADRTENYCVKAYKTYGANTFYSEPSSEKMEAPAFKKTEEMEAKVDYWVGDSRTVYLGQDLNVYFRCYGMVGAKYDWFSGVADPWVRLILDDKPDATIIFNFGVNDVEESDQAVDDYIAKYKQLMEDYPKANIWIMSVNPTDERYSWAEVWGITAQDMMEHVKHFNAKMQAAFPDKYIDTYTYLMETGYETLDGLHYPVDVTEKIYWYALSWIS